MIWCNPASGPGGAAAHKARLMARITASANTTGGSGAGLLPVVAAAHLQNNGRPAPRRRSSSTTAHYDGSVLAVSRGGGHRTGGAFATRSMRWTGRRWDLSVMAGFLFTTQRSLENARRPGVRRVPAGLNRGRREPPPPSQSGLLPGGDSSRSQRWCNIRRKTSALSSGNVKSHENSHGPTHDRAIRSTTRTGKHFLDNATAIEHWMRGAVAGSSAALLASTDLRNSGFQASAPVDH